MAETEEFIGELLRSENFLQVAAELNTAALVQHIVAAIREVEAEQTAVLTLVGGAASGKSALTRLLIEALECSASVCTDDFVIGDRAYRREHLEGKDPTKKYDLELLNSTVNKIIALEEGEQTKVPLYDEPSGASIALGEENYRTIIGKLDYLIVEGDFLFVQNPNFQIYLHVADDVRLENRIRRDCKDRSETCSASVVENFKHRQINQHIPHTLPCTKTADLLISVIANPTGGRYDYHHSIFRRA